MSRRLDKTLPDYVAIAISPVLIMFLVGSLLFFLVEVFYVGRYDARMNWIFFWFTIAIVLIARISIELGQEKAGVYAAGLAMAVFLAMSQFLGGSLLVSLALIGLIWWSAHKLTFDCTLIDEDEDASGEGLMQTIGLDRSAANTGPPVSDGPTQPEAEPEGVTSREPDEEPSTWWERFRERQKRPHSPGIWVVYFSLASLPLFGIGHLFVRDPASRRYVFGLLMVYVASGLGLLLTTSFLGLRRYLRQRHLEMPPAMAGLWIAIGCAMVVGLLFVCMLLPRPGAELVAELPFSIDTPDRKASRFDILGGEAADEDEDGPRTGTREDDPPPPSESEGEEGDSSETSGTSDEPGSGAEGEKKGTGSGGEKGGGSEGEKGSGSEGEKGGSEGKKGGGSEGEKGSGAEGEKGGSEGEKGSGSEGEKGGSEGEKGSGSEGEKGGSEGKKGGGSEGKKGSGDEGEKGESEGEKGGESSGAESQREDRRQSSGQSDEKEERESQTAKKERSGGSSPKRPPLSPQAVLQGAANWVALLFKWILCAVLLAVVIYALWRSRAEWPGLLERLREFWRRLFGGKPGAADETALAPEGSDGPGLRRFSDYPDPFATGDAGRYSPDELVSYSFNALEAWARDQGWPREPDQTPHEFAHQLGARVESLSEDVRRLADLYCRVAYAPDTVPRKSVTALRDLWYKLEPPRRTSFETRTSV